MSVIETIIKLKKKYYIKNTYLILSFSFVRRDELVISITVDFAY